MAFRISVSVLPYISDGPVVRECLLFVQVLMKPPTSRKIWEVAFSFLLG